MDNKSETNKEILFLQKWIEKYKSDFNSPGEEFFLVTLKMLAAEYVNLMYIYTGRGQNEDALMCIENSIKYYESFYELLKYWRRKVLPYIVEEGNDGFISRLFNTRKQSIINELKDLLNQFGINAHHQNIETFLKGEKWSFVKMDFSNKDKFEAGRISMVSSLHDGPDYIIPKIIFWDPESSNTELIEFLSPSLLDTGRPATIFYKIFTGYILGNDISKEIDFFTSKKNSYYFYVKDMAFAMKYLKENNREKFLESLKASLDGYKKDCRSFLNGFKDQPEEKFSLDALAVARLGALKGWKIDIEHEKFPKEFFNFILEKTLPK